MTVDDINDFIAMVQSQKEKDPKDEEDFGRNRMADDLIRDLLQLKKQLPHMRKY